MSFWGYLQIALNACFNLQFLYFNFQGCLEFLINKFFTNFATAPIGESITIKFYEELKFTILNSTAIFNIGRMKANKRIGPHNKEILSIIYGSLLGDGHAEKRSKGNGTRISFYQEGSHGSYLIWLHKKVSDLGYCNPVLPEIKTRLGNKGTVRKIIRFHTFTFSSLN